VKTDAKPPPSRMRDDSRLAEVTAMERTWTEPAENL